MMLLTPLAPNPWIKEPLLTDVPQDKVVIIPLFTTRVRVQVWPPILIAKLAVPLVLGVPVIT